MSALAEDYVLLGLRLGRHVDGLVDSYCGPAELKEQVDAEPLAEPAALVARGRRAARRARGRLAARPGARAAHLRGRARGRRALVLGRGRALLRRPARAVEHRRLRGRPRAARGAAAGRRRPRRPLRGVAEANLVPGGPASFRPSGTRRRAARRDRERSSSCRRARGSSSRRFATSPGGRSTTTSAICAAGSSSTSTCRTRRRHRRARRPRGLPGPPHGALRQGAAPHPRAGELEESIQLVPTPASLAQEGLAETGPDLIIDGDAAATLDRASRRHGLECDWSGGARDARGEAADAPDRARRGADDPRGRRVGG